MDRHYEDGRGDGATHMMTIVTAFVPIPDHPRTPEEYHKLAVPLLALRERYPMMSAVGDIHKCWLYNFLRGDKHFTYSLGDNPKKNSLSYHIVQAQKTQWLLAATQVDRVADVFVWIDYGILHVPGVTLPIIEAFLHRVEWEQAIAIPGCWNRDYEYRDDYPCWRFCGGVMIVPRPYVEPLHCAMQTEYARWLDKTGNISWEVNTLARVEEQRPDLPIWWYRADHNYTMFTNYRATEFADRPDVLCYAH
jgi:hypothetical protein